VKTPRNENGEHGPCLPTVADWQNLLTVGVGLSVNHKSSFTRGDWASTSDAQSCAAEALACELENKSLPKLSAVSNIYRNYMTLC